MEIAGDLVHCPLCGGRLTGIPSEANWPSPGKLKKKSKAYRIQLQSILLAFIVVLIVFTALGMDSFRNFILFFLMWFLLFEITLYRFIKSYKTLSWLFTHSAIAAIIGLLLSTFWFPGLVAWIPIPLMAILVFNFFITILDRSGYIIIHFITFFFAGIISWIFIIVLMKYHLNVLWNVCFLVSLATFTVTFIVRRKKLLEEFHKRFFL